MSGNETHYIPMSPRYVPDQIDYAKNLHRALYNGDYRKVSIGKRYEIKTELRRVVTMLYGYNVNLSDLLRTRKGIRN